MPGRSRSSRCGCSRTETRRRLHCRCWSCWRPARRRSTSRRTRRCSGRRRSHSAPTAGRRPACASAHAPGSSADRPWWPSRGCRPGRRSRTHRCSRCWQRPSRPGTSVRCRTGWRHRRTPSTYGRSDCDRRPPDSSQGRGAHGCRSGCRLGRQPQALRERKRRPEPSAPDVQTTATTAQRCRRCRLRTSATTPVGRHGDWLCWPLGRRPPALGCRR